MLENQLSRWGAIAKHIPLMNPTAKVFILAPSTADYYGDLAHEFPVDRQGFNRVHSTFAGVIANGGLVASRGDVVLVLPGYTETLTATQSLSVAGVRWIGIGEGTLKPTITMNAAQHAIGISAANVEFSGFRFAAPSTDEALSMIKIKAAGAVIKDIVGIGSGSAKNFTDCIIVASGADDLIMENIRVTNRDTVVNSFISITGTVTRWKMKDVYFAGTVGTAGIIDSARANDLNWENITISVTGSAKPAATLDSNPDGQIRNSFFAGTHTTLATNFNPGSNLRLNQCYVLEETDSSKQGALIPAVDVD